jgi:hypothetical protein
LPAEIAAQPAVTAAAIAEASPAVYIVCLTTKSHFARIYYYFILADELINKSFKKY